MKVIVARETYNQSLESILKELENRDNIQIHSIHVIGNSITVFCEEDNILQSYGKVQTALYQVKEILAKERVNGKVMLECDHILHDALLTVEAELEKNNRVWATLGRRMNTLRRNLWDEFHDLKYQLERLSSDVESDYRTRNWTSIDWQQWEYVSKNVD
jgi:CII-binding regulator of phage lambda lysogenization HflD